MMTRIVRFFGDPEHDKVRRRLFLAVLALIVIADFLVPRDHGEFFWDHLPGWATLFGLVSCTVIVFVSKFLGHQGGIMRREDYYD